MVSWTDLRRPKAWDRSLPPHPDVEDAVGHRLQFFFYPGQVLIAGGQVDHGGGLKDRHVPVLRPLSGNLLDGLDVGITVVHKELGQDEAPQDGGKGAVALRQLFQLLGAAHPNEDQGEVELLLGVVAADLLQGAEERLLGFLHRSLRHRVLQTEDQGEGLGVPLVPQGVGNALVGVGWAVQQGAHVVTTDGWNH